MQYLNVCVSTLLYRHPWAAEVLEWHGVDLETVEPRLSIGALCWLESIDHRRLMRDLIASQPDSDAVDIFGALESLQEQQGGEDAELDDDDDDDDDDSFGSSVRYDYADRTRSSRHRARRSPMW